MQQRKINQHYIGIETNNLYMKINLGRNKYMTICTKEEINKIHNTIGSDKYDLSKS